MIICNKCERYFKLTQCKSWEHGLCPSCYYGRNYVHKERVIRVRKHCKKCGKPQKCGTYKGRYPTCWTKYGLCGDCMKPMTVIENNKKKLERMNFALQNLRE